MGVLVGKDTHDAGSYFVMDNRLVIFAYDINPEFLLDLSDEHTGGRLGTNNYVSICRIRSPSQIGAEYTNNKHQENSKCLNIILDHLSWRLDILRQIQTTTLLNSSQILLKIAI